MAPPKEVNAWDRGACCTRIVVITNNGLNAEIDLTRLRLDTLEKMAPESKVEAGGTVRAKHPLQNNAQGVAYFEVKMVEKSNLTFIGLVPLECPMNKSIGRYPGAYCIVSDGNLLIFGETREFGPEFGHNRETVGCGVKPNGQLFFTLNGQMLEKNGPLPKIDASVELFPAVSLSGNGTKVEANFGDDVDEKPFLFDLDTLK